MPRISKQTMVQRLDTYYQQDDAFRDSIYNSLVKAFDAKLEATGFAVDIKIADNPYYGTQAYAKSPMHTFSALLNDYCGHLEFTEVSALYKRIPKQFFEQA